MNSVSERKLQDHPIKKASIISKIFLGWQAKLFRKGRKNNLKIEDLYETLPTHKSNFLGDQLEINWNAELQKQKLNSNYKADFFKAVIKTFYRSIIIQFCILLALECGFFLISPFLLRKLIEVFARHENQIATNEVLLYSGLLILNTFIVAVGSKHSSNARVLLGIRVKIACCSLIYRKILRLKLSSLSQTSNGQIINLLSNDVNRFDMVFIFVFYILISPIQVFIVTYCLWQTVQSTCLVGMVVLALITFPVQGYFGKLNGTLRNKIAKLTDRRVLLMNEIISGIQGIKMYAWEKPFENFVRIARLNEIKVLKYSSYIKGYNAASMNYTERLPMFATAITYALLGNAITSEKLFSMTQYFYILQSTMSFFFARSISVLSETRITINRIQTFLDLEEINLTHDNLFTDSGNGDIHFQNYSASWTNGHKTLKNITTTIKSGEICAVIGSSGSGKSSMLNAILSEIQKDSGDIRVNGSVSYSSQQPWLFGGSVRDNILFGLPYDDVKYKKVIAACSLTHDFVQFLNKDQTLVGDNGSLLSGGQKARINLARAIYRDANIYLLDDPLSAVDANVGKHIFQECIEKYLSNKTRIVVTHQIQYLQNVNHVIALKNGEIEAEGLYKQIMDHNLESTRCLGEKFIESNEKIIIKNVKNNKCNEIVEKTSSMDNIKPKILENEKMETGKLKPKVFLDYIKAAGNKCEIAFVLVLMFGNQIVNNLTDYWMAYWTNLEDTRKIEDYNVKIVYVNESSIAESLNNVKYEYTTNFLSRTDVMCIYGLLILLVISTSIGRALYFYKLCMQASINLHNTMFNTLLTAPMRFFDKNSIGRILNRCTNDVGIVDELLPGTLEKSAQISMVVLGGITLVSTVNPYLIIPTLILIYAFSIIQKIYLATTQDIKRLEGITKSPVFTHTSSSVAGLETIRSCKVEKLLEMEFDQHQDLHTSARYLMAYCITSLGLCVDMICVIYIAIVITSFILINNSVFSGSEVGLALSKSLALLMSVQYGIHQMCDTICHMTSVERILQYTEIETEGPFKTTKNNLPKLWPNSGCIEFRKVNVRYDTYGPNILTGLNLEINSREKIGIVGRTGAGKSSLISSLFRLSIIDGDIIIDNINIRNIGLRDLRSRISIIPQQPVLFSATMRYNLDPFNEYEDHVLWKVLEEVKLKEFVNSLDSEVQSGGSNFSVGQRQLICLARAILKQNEILVLDEATANVDPHTDTLIQQTICEKFKSCTVLTIAHRLNTIMNSDRVLVMDAGQMVEFDHPNKLLQNKNGMFYKLYQESNSLEI